jgi:hypothetical protein
LADTPMLRMVVNDNDCSEDNSLEVRPHSLIYKYTFAVSWH